MSSEDGGITSKNLTSCFPSSEAVIEEPGELETLPEEGCSALVSECLTLSKGRKWGRENSTDLTLSLSILCGWLPRLVL